MNSHLFHLGQMEPQDKIAGAGYRARVTKSNFPALQGMSLYKLILFAKSFREPHWHANAEELGFCIKGKVLVTLYATNNVKATYLVNPGESFFIPSGSLHALENVGEEDAELIFQFSHEEPEDFGLASAIDMFSDAVLGNTWNVSDKIFQAIKRPIISPIIARAERQISVPKEALYVTTYKHNLEGGPALIANEDGTVKVAREDTWPILKKQSLYSLRLTGKGMREPHWHPETAEMGYVHAGKGRMSILSPSGNIDTYEMNQGDVYFIPKAYPHHIENLDNIELHIYIFFDRSMPEDIGFTASVKSNSNAVLGAILKCSPDLFNSLPTYYQDLLLVNKINALD